MERPIEFDVSHFAVSVIDWSMVSIQYPGYLIAMRKAQLAEPSLGSLGVVRHTFARTQEVTKEPIWGVRGSASTMAGSQYNSSDQRAVLPA